MANLPMKQEHGFINRIKQFFRKLFYKKKEIVLQEVIQNVKIPENNQTANSFKERLETEVENDYLKDIEKDDFIKKIEKNPNILYGLSLDRLEKLEKYYDKLLEKDRLELERLKKATS